VGDNPVPHGRGVGEFAEVHEVAKIGLPGAPAIGQTFTQDPRQRYMLLSIPVEDRTVVECRVVEDAAGLLERRFRFMNAVIEVGGPELQGWDVRSMSKCSRKALFGLLRVP